MHAKMFLVLHFTTLLADSLNVGCLAICSSAFWSANIAAHWQTLGLRAHPTFLALFVTITFLRAHQLAPFCDLPPSARNFKYQTLNAARNAGHSTFWRIISAKIISRKPSRPLRKLANGVRVGDTSHMSVPSIASVVRKKPALFKTRPKTSSDSVKPS